MDWTVTYGGVMTRAEILDTGHKWRRAARIRIEAPPAAVFDVLADPRRHSQIDGSGTVQGNVSGPKRLELGSTFGMSMHLKVPYTMTNTVVEFEEGRRIAWRHIGRHRWRYELEPTDDGATIVTETFDGSTALFPPALRLMNAYGNNEMACAKTLVRLKSYVESGAH